MVPSPLATPPVAVRPPSLPPLDPFPPDAPPPTVWMDARLVVLDKPAGLLAVPGRGDAGTVNLHRWAEQHWGPLGVVHRLDMATSGLIVFARDASALRHLGEQFARRQVDKAYEALVHGHPAAEAGTIELPLAADWPQRPRQKVCLQSGRPALTRWWRMGAVERPEDPAQACSRLRLQPVTGRSHQLRVHLWASGHPIVGDALYGSDRDGSAPRLMLHACGLRLAHPASGETLTFESPVPF